MPFAQVRVKTVNVHILFKPHRFTMYKYVLQMQWQSPSATKRMSNEKEKGTTYK
jgi:hypothetical protein